MTRPYDAALAYREAGWLGTLPLPAGMKKHPPTGYTGADGRWPTEGQVIEWSRNGVSNIALRLPPEVIGVDVDAYGEKHGDATLARLEAAFGPLPATWKSTSREAGPSGIMLFRVPPEAEAGLAGLAGPDIEIIRYGHRYVVASPSLHPEGRRYRWIRPNGTDAAPGELPKPDELPDLPSRWLIGLTGADGTAPEGSRKGRREKEQAAADWLDRLADGDPCLKIADIGAELVEAAGRGFGSAHDASRDVILALLREGALGHVGVRRALDRAESVYVETVRDRPEPQTPLESQAEWRRMVIGGVIKIITEYPDPVVGDQECGPRTTDGWPELEPLVPDDALPVFPLDALPDWMAAHVRAVAATTETDPALGALAALGVAAGPLSNRYRVQTPIWSERTIALFTCGVADTGELKTEVFEAHASPLRQHEAAVREDEAPALVDLEATRKEIQQRLDLARTELRNAIKKQVAGRTTTAPDDVPPDEDVDRARRLIRQAQAELDAPDNESREPYALLADDSTPEALQRQMAAHDGRVAIISAESELFAMAAGRYSDHGADLKVYLSGYSGEPLNMDRITRDTPPIPRPGLTVAISTQPIVLETARNRPELIERGFLARFIFAIVKSRAGTRRLATRPHTPDSVIRAYRDEVVRIARLGDSRTSTGAATLQVVGPAWNALIEWHDEQLEPRRSKHGGDLGDIESVAGWAGRLHGTVVRLAAILHIAEHQRDAITKPIDEATIRSAIRIAEWAMPHAFAAFGLSQGNAESRRAERLRRWYLARSEPTSTFTVREAQRGIRGMTTDQVRAAVGFLEERGYVRLAKTRPGFAGGRPQEVVHVSPKEAE